MSPFRKRSKVGILLEFLLDTTLLAIFVAQAFILGCLLAYGYIPIPTEWASKQISSQLPQGFRLEVSTIRLKLNGEIELSDVSAWTSTIQQPIFQSDGAVIHWKLDKENDYKPTAESLVVSNGTLFLPAVYSPDGLRRPILDKIAFRIIPESELLRIDSFAALHETIRLRGSIEWPLLLTTEKETNFDTQIHGFYKYSAAAIKERSRFNLFTTPTIAFHLTADEDQSINLVTRLSSRKLTHAYATGENFLIDAQLRIKEGQLIAESPLKVQAKTLESAPYSISSSGLDAMIAKDEWQTLLHGQLPNLQIFAYELNIHEFSLEAPIIRIQPKTFPLISFQGATSGLKGAVTFDGTLDITKQTGLLNAKGNVDLVSLIPDDLQTEIPQLIFAKAPYYDLQLEFTEGFTLDYAQLNALTYDVSVGGITIDHIDAHASFKDDVYTLDEVFVRRGSQWVDLKFSLDTQSWDYRTTLIGTAVPYEYNALLPSWWEAIFLDFDFSEVQRSHGDFIIYGNAKQSSADLYYGHALAENVRYKDIMVDHATVTVRGRGSYSEVTDIDALSNGGWAKGHLSFSSLKDEVSAPAAVRMKFDAQLSLEDSKKIFGGDIAAILNDFEVEQLPRIQLDGAIFNDAYTEYRGHSYFDLVAQSNGPIKFKNVPLDDLNFSLFGRGAVTSLRDVQFGYAGGKGKGAIDILTTDNTSAALRYRLEINDADQARAIRNLPQLDTIEGELSLNKNTASNDISRVEGRIYATLHAQGPVDTPYQHDGYGSFLLESKNLGSIQVLGPLSRLLKDTRFSFTSFNLETMSAKFRLKDGSMHFDPLQIDGPRTGIKAPGSLRLNDQALDMRVSVNLFANVGTPNSPLKRAGNLITQPIPNLLVFDLTGTVKEQKWRSLYDPRNLIPKF